MSTATAIRTHYSRKTLEGMTFGQLMTVKTACGQRAREYALRVVDGRNVAEVDCVKCLAVVEKRRSNGIEL
jgi:hypothetical protein